MTTDATHVRAPSGFERFVVALESFGLNAARLLLALTITLAVLLFLAALTELVASGLHYQIATSSDKNHVATITFTPNFANLTADGHRQTSSDHPIIFNRDAALLKSKDALIGARLASLSEAGLGIGCDEAGKCADLGKQHAVMAQNWGSDEISAFETKVALGAPIPKTDPTAFYGAYGFGSEDDALKAEWDAVNTCLGVYNERNGNLYLQKTPELFSAVEAQCDYDYNRALANELDTRPKDWTILDTAFVMTLIWVLVGLGVTIVTIALTIMFFRLEKNFRWLRNLERL